MQLRFVGCGDAFGSGGRFMLGRLDRLACTAASDGMIVSL
jgi:hypothetical protein